MDQHSDEVALLRRLLEQNVPEIASAMVEIRGLARDPGRRSIIVVTAHGDAVDAVGAIVGSRGSRIKPVVAELGSEKIDVVRWSDSREQFLGNLFTPNKVLQIRYDQTTQRAMITLAADVIDSSSPMRLRLASELVGWNLILE